MRPTKHLHMCFNLEHWYRLDLSRRLAKLLKRNVELFAAETISFQRFGRRQLTLWRYAGRQGLSNDVLRELNITPEPPGESS